MIHVLRHYLPFRKALLVASETVLLTGVVHWGMSLHLRGALTQQVITALAIQGFDRVDALNRCLVSAAIVSVLAQVAISFNELYEFRVSGSKYERAARFLTSAGSAVLLAIAAVVAARLTNQRHLLDFPGIPTTQRVLLLTLSLIAGFALLYGWRHLFHAFLRRLRLDEKILILGSGRAARSLVREILERPGSGYEISGLVSPDGCWAHAARDEPRPAALRFVPGTPRAESEPAPSSGPTTEGAAAVALDARADGEAAAFFLEHPSAEPGTAPVAEQADEEAEAEAAAKTAEAGPRPEPERLTESLPELAERLGVDSIAVALEDRRGVEPVHDLLRCRLDGVIVEESEALFERVTGKIAVEAMRPSYLIYNAGFVQSAGGEVAKRLADLLAAIFGLIVLAPVMAVTAILVRLDSPGPVLFRQERCGRHGKPFTLMKFRSMRQDAEKHSGPVWASQDDPRITRFGNFMRKSRLDELPQLVNVLLGDMSMVGPRPERPHFVADLAEKIPYFEQRHIVKPGLTGWAQINYPYGNTLEDAVQKLQYDLFYIKYQSTLFDLSILFNTIKTVVLRRGT